MNIQLSNINDFITRQLGALSHLLYPDICIACNERLITVENAFCFECYTSLPFAHQINDSENDFLKHFEGKAKLVHGAALLNFIKTGAIQDIIKKLKYHDRPQYGVILGEIFAKSMSAGNKFGEIDVVVPVPLHPKKEMKRGYNQSYMFAKGIGNILECDVSCDNLIRVKNTQTQTKLDNVSRMKNVKNAFVVSNPDIFIGKHVLVVDDVLTTGSTLLACYFALQDIEGISISFATIATGDLM
ncbi:MAG: phosphoribosyltransferase family protein [Saprospiraceae bacterium]